MTVKSADNLIIQEEAKKLGRELPPLIPEKAIEAPVAEDPVDPKDPAPEAEPAQLPLAAESEAEAEAEAEEDGEDPYGNKVSPPKMYSEEEVQRMIRERLARGKQNPDQAQVDEAARDFKADPESEESWETQLGDFVEKKIAQIEHKKQQTVFQEKEIATQAQFEEKFSTGMSKYNDFQNVVSGKPITAGMMMATRTMENPAAFIYAACKQQPAEVERIAKIQDPYAQCAEMGRLEERMKKARILSNAPKPGKRVSGDRTDNMPKQSIDQLIAAHAKDKIMITRPGK